MKILVTGAGGAAAISVWKSLGEAHELYMADIDPCAAGLYLVPPSRRLLIPRGDSADFASVLLHHCQHYGIEVLIATVDAELFQLAQHANEFERSGVTVPLSSEKVLQLCRDKYLLLTFCKEMGVTPCFQLLTEDTQLLPTSFPYFAKPRCGSGATGATVIKHSGEVALLPKDGTYLIQELLSGEEFSVDVYIHSSGQPIAAVPRLRMKIDSGIAVAAQTSFNPELAAMAIEIAQKVGIRYVANIQFKADRNGQFKLLEINPRFPGTLPLTAAAGVDIPRLLINDLLGKPFGTELMPFKELMVVRYWTEHFFPIKEWDALCGR